MQAECHPEGSRTGWRPTFPISAKDGVAVWSGPSSARAVSFLPLAPRSARPRRLALSEVQKAPLLCPGALPLRPPARQRHGQHEIIVRALAPLTGRARTVGVVPAQVNLG